MEGVKMREAPSKQGRDMASVEQGLAICRRCSSTGSRRVLKMILNGMCLAQSMISYMPSKVQVVNPSKSDNDQEVAKRSKVDEHCLCASRIRLVQSHHVTLINKQRQQP